MARHDMPAQFVAHLQRPFKVDPFAHRPARQVGLADAFRRNLHIKPIARAIAQRHHGQAYPFAGNRRANINAGHIIGRADTRAQIAPLLQLQHFAHIRHDSGEHHLAPFAWLYC